MIMKTLLIVVIALFLGACASTQNVAVSPDTLDSLRGKSLVLVQRESPGFVAMTAGKGAFAVVGVGAAIAEGNKMVEENSVADPVMTISKAVADGLVINYGLALHGEAVNADSGDVESLVKQAGATDYALDVVTNGWGYMYNGFKFGDYYVGYSSKLRLIDVTTAKVISSGFCAYDAKKRGKAPVSRDKLLADNAAYIKQELADAANLCIQEFSANLFSVSSNSVAQQRL